MPARTPLPDTAPWSGPREGVVAERQLDGEPLDPRMAARMKAGMYPCEENDGPTRPGPATLPDTDHKEPTMPNFTDDLDIIDPTTIEQSGPAYPAAQWLNGDPKMAAAGGVAHTGGVILPAKYVDEQVAPAPGWTRTTVAFSSGKSEAVLAAQKPRLAVIRTRFRWFVVYNGVTTFYPRSGYQENTGMRGKVQALCAIHGYDFPLTVTLTGKASQEFERLLRDFREKIATAAARIKAGSRWPGFAFWMRLAPGPHVKVGQKGQESIITPPTLELPNVITEDYLSKTYVGRAKLEELQGLFHLSTDWAHEWDRGGAEAEWDVDPETGEIKPGNGRPPVPEAPPDDPEW